MTKVETSVTIHSNSSMTLYLQLSQISVVLILWGAKHFVFCEEKGVMSIDFEPDLSL